MRGGGEREEGEQRDPQAQLKAEHGVVPGLAVILVGARKDSQSYAPRPKSHGHSVFFFFFFFFPRPRDGSKVRNKKKAAEEALGVRGFALLEEEEAGGLFAACFC